MYKYSTVVFCR